MPFCYSLSCQKNYDGQGIAHVFTVGNEMKFHFASQTEVLMTSDALLNWLCGSSTSSATDLAAPQVFSQEQINSDNTIVFPLAGREESLRHIASCFSTSYQQRFSKDRNSRPIPVCTGIPGLGKTRLMDECATTVLDMTPIPGERISGIVSFGNDGNAYGAYDEVLGIQCAFAWRVLHVFFKAQHKYQSWMREKSPKNRKMMTLDLALSIIELHWSQKTDENILVFVGIDEYQKLDQEKLNSLLDILCDSSRRSTDSKLSFFCMLAGTDLNMTRIARTSHPNTQRTPIRFLTHQESMAAIGPYISKFHSDFVVNEAFAQNVFYLGGVPRLLTEFAKKVTSMDLVDLVGNSLKEARRALLSNLQNPQLSLSDILKLLAISFTNTPIVNVQDRPFPGSLQPAARNLTWSQMIANGICLLQDDGRVIVPFHLVSQALERRQTESNPLNQFEMALLSSLNDLSFDPEISILIVPAWLSWEAFGANFYCIRINSFLVLGISALPLSLLFRGSRFSSDIFNVPVHLRVAKVFPSIQQYGPDMPRIITKKNATFYSVDWVDSETLHIVLNGDDGAGVDVFFILKRADCSGYIILLDQRKRLGSNVTDSNLSSFKSKLPSPPVFLEKFKLEPVYGLMSIYSQIIIDPVPESTFFVSSTDSLYFHGTLFDHPGCSMAIDVNSALKTSIGQIFEGTKKRRMELAESIISQRKKKRIENYDDLLSLVSGWEEELDESACARIKF